MTKPQIIKATKEFVEKKFTDEGTGHDWWHMYRVWKLSKYIASKEKNADLFIVEIGALLHDIADWKFNDDSFEAGPEAARKWLTKLKVDRDVISKVEDIIRNVSYRGAGVKQD